MSSGAFFVIIPLNGKASLFYLIFITPVLCTRFLPNECGKKKPGSRFRRIPAVS